MSGTRSLTQHFVTSRGNDSLLHPGVSGTHVDEDDSLKWGPIDSKEVSVPGPDTTAIPLKPSSNMWTRRTKGVVKCDTPVV